MGFKEENYTHQGLRCICVYLILLLSCTCNSSFGQIAPHCPVRVDFEPRIEHQSKSANAIRQNSFPFFNSWDALNNVKLSDDQYAQVSFNSVKRSTMIEGSNFGFNIPNGAKINGIELIVEGHTTGEGHIEGNIVQLLNYQGKRVGNNFAKKVLPENEDWLVSEDSTDFVWVYGGEFDDWGTDLNEFLITNPNFGYSLQVRNKLPYQADVFVDNIEMVVYYTPLYSVCSNHACVPFYIEESDDPLVTYEWYIPQGFEMISDSEHDYAINIGPSYATFGTYEICVESFYDEDSQGVCCRRYNYTDCNPGKIEGTIFLDENGDFKKDSGDDRLSNIFINLYRTDGSLVTSTSSDINGFYSFVAVSSGDYYIEVVNGDEEQIFVVANIGASSEDSDITDSFGLGTSSTITVTPNQVVTDIDAGLSARVTIGDFIWEDINGDGIQQDDEPGIADAQINLSHTVSGLWNTTSDQNGFYQFTNIPSGQLSLSINTPSGYSFTIVNAAAPELDNDFGDGPVEVTLLNGGQIDTLDAGFVRYSSIGDYVWEDTNMDGIQDSVELGIPGVTVYLKDELGAVLDSTNTDEDGLYIFDELVPSTYLISLVVDTFLTLTPSGDGTNIDSDSNGIFDGTSITTLPILLGSNENLINIDFGLFYLPIEIGGATWIDSNNDGIYQFEEPFISNIAVSLYDNNDSLIDETLSDEGGIFLFSGNPAGDYYLNFDLPDGHIFTLANIGDDLLDSDVDDTNGTNTTAMLSLNPGDVSFTNGAGYLALPKVGDYVWLDSNRNGIQDEDESGINGVTVSLYDASANLIDQMISQENQENGNNGYYLFDTLEIGEYYIHFSAIDTLDYTILVEDEADQDSDVNGDNGDGTTSIFSLIGNQCNLDMDAGFSLQKSNVSGEAWIDSDQDGLQNIGDLLIAEVIVDLYNSDNTIIASTTTDSLGRYSFNAIEGGDYYIVFTPSERYITTDADLGTDEFLDSDVTDNISIGSTDIFTLTEGIDTEGVDVGLIDGAIDIEGFTWIDDNGDGVIQITELPLAGVKVILFDTSGVAIDSTTTDVNGYYNFEKNIANNYYLTFDSQDETYFNTIADQGVDDNLDDDVTSEITTNSTSEISITYFDELEFTNAGYYQLSSIGDMTFIDENENGINDSEPGLDRVTINLLDETGSTVMSTETMQGGGVDSGYYIFENIPPGKYQIQYIRPLFYQFIMADVGADDTIDSDVTSVEANEGTTEIFAITSGTSNLQYDAGFIYQTPMESSINGLVWLDLNANGLRENDEPVSENVVVDLLSSDGSIIETKTTQSDGTYTFENLQEGFYSILANVASGKTSTIPNIGTDDSIDSDFINEDEIIETNQFFLEVFQDLSNIDLGMVTPLTIGNFVWNDLNNNGTQESNEDGIKGVEVTIVDITNSISETTITDSLGNYQFENIPAGSYKICTTVPEGYFIGKKDQGVEQLDSDANPDGCTDFVMIPGGGINLDIDIAMTKNGSIKGIAFVDFNGNGIQNPFDPGIEEIPVELYSSADVLIETTSTSSLGETTGYYTFTNIPVGDYYVVFTFPEAYIITDPNAGPEEIDSDITNTNGSTDIITIDSGEEELNIDGGAYLPASIGSLVWEDENQDGIKDESEKGVEGVEIIIFRSFGVPFDTVYSDQDGMFAFTGLKQGLYFIQFVISQQYTISPIDIGNDDNIDSDADETGKTPLISLAHGADLTSIGCGIYGSMASLRSVVWEDLNGDGERQANEARIPDIRITLYNDQDQAIASTTSNSLGLYAFQEIPEGDYNVFVDLNDTEYAFTDANMTGEDMFDSDIMPNGESEIFTSAVVLSVPNIDVGLYESGSINGIVWGDTNHDGVYDMNETTLSGINATLYRSTGEMVNQIATIQSEENMIFENVSPGSYYIKYTTPETIEASLANSYTEEDNNSDVIMQAGQYMSPTFQVKSGRVVTNIDAGFYEKPIITPVQQQVSTIKTEESSIIAEDTSLSLSIHPNPAAEYIRINTNKTENSKIKVLNAEKKVILELDAKHLETIDLQDLHPGIYYVILESGGKSISKKLIKVQ